MATYHLRPVSDNSPSPSPSASTTPPGDHSPASFKHNPRSRRPLSPTSLRDLDLSSDPPTRKYPAPPTGHDLMAMFPPPPPELFPEMRPGPTSGFFQRQERAFFAQAGKEIVRVRVEVDIPDHDKSITPALLTGPAHHLPPRSAWPQPPTPSSHNSPPASSASSPPLPYPHQPSSRSSTTISASSNPPSNRPPMTSTPLFPSPHSQHSQPPPHPSQHHPVRTSPHSHSLPPHPLPHSHSHSHSSGSVDRAPPPINNNNNNNNTLPPKQEFPPSPDEFRPPDDPDESWRRPMPYNERRRAGKHTRRVIVRN